LEAKFDSQVLNGWPAKDCVHRDVSAQGDAENSWSGVGVGVWQVVANYCSELAMGVFVESGRVFDSTN
jgi:hypothetical protein